MRELMTDTKERSHPVGGKVNVSRCYCGWKVSAGCVSCTGLCWGSYAGHSKGSKVWKKNEKRKIEKKHYSLRIARTNCCQFTWPTERRPRSCRRVAGVLLHTITCDDVSVKHIARFGPCTPTRPDDKPRPVKLDLMSTDSHRPNKVLKHAKTWEQHHV